MKSNIRNKVLLILSTLAILCIVVVTVYIINDRKMLEYESNQIQTSNMKTVNFDSSSKLTIGLVGDSWVAGEKMDLSIENKLNSVGINADVISSGHPGARSREIYSNLISDSSNKFSSNFILTDENVDILIIIAGVNDTTSHFGESFYSQHMQNIVQLANDNSKLPVIVEIPEFGIEEPVSPIPSEVKHDIYKILFDGGKTNIISDYNNALQTSLSNTDLNYEIIPFEPITHDYHMDIELYENPWHLNKQGYELLGTHIGESLIKVINNN